MYAGVNPSWLVYQDNNYKVTGSETVSDGYRVIQIVASFQSLAFVNGVCLNNEQYKRDPATGYLLIKDTVSLPVGATVSLSNLSELRFDHTYTRGQMDTLIASKMDMQSFNTAISGYYNKQQVDAKTSNALLLWSRLF